MRRNLRQLGATAFTLALAMSVAAVPMTRAQDGATPPPFCAILTAQEVSGAVGADVAPTYGDERSCNYASSAEDVFTSLSVTNGGTTMDIAKSIHTGGEDMTLAGRPSYLTAENFSRQLFIDRGDGDTLSFQLLAAPEGLDSRAALSSLGELAFPRLATLVIPTPTPPPPVVQVDPELAALFPTEISGAPVPVQTFGGDMMTANEDDPEALARLDALLATQGKTRADLSFGFAFGVDPPYSIGGFRVRGADVAAFRDEFLGLMAQGAPVTPTPVQVAGKDTVAITVGEQLQHVYPRNDVIWAVTAQEPVLTEIFQKLP